MPVVFGPADNTASLIGMILSLTLGPEILPETTFGEHNPPCHLQLPTKSISCKKEAICEHGPEAASCLVGQDSFKMDCFKVEKCSMVRRVQIWNSCRKSQTLCPPGQRGGRPSSVSSVFSSKTSISDGMGVHKCIWYGQLACFGRHYECWKVYIKILEQHMLPSRQRVFQERPCVFQQDNAKPLQLFQQHGFIVEESMCWIGLPAVQIFHLKRIFGASLNEKYVKDDHKLFSSWKPISGKYGTKFKNSRNS